MSETNDALFGGAVRIRQPARSAGYRVNVDAVLLAAFASKKRVRHAVDLGAGVGGVGLSLLHLGAAERVTMIEIDETLARLAQANAAANGWEERIRVVEADVARVTFVKERAPTVAGRSECGDLLVCNPPYVMPGRGREPAARHRVARLGDLGVFVDAARRAVGRRARAAFVYPAIEAMALFQAFRERGLEPKRLRAVHAKPREPARVVLVEVAAGKPGGLVIDPPLVESEARSFEDLVQRART